MISFLPLFVIVIIVSTCLELAKMISRSSGIPWWQNISAGIIINPAHCLSLFGTLTLPIRSYRYNPFIGDSPCKK